MTHYAGNLVCPEPDPDGQVVDPALYEKLVEQLPNRPVFFADGKSPCGQVFRAWVDGGAIWAEIDLPQMNIVGTLPMYIEPMSAGLHIRRFMSNGLIAIDPGRLAVHLTPNQPWVASVPLSEVVEESVQ